MTLAIDFDEREREEIKRLAKMEIRTFEEMARILVRMGLKEYNRRGWDHTKPWPGDHGILFEKRTNSKA